MNRSILITALLASSVLPAVGCVRGDQGTLPATPTACAKPASTVDGYIAAWNTAERELRHCLLTWVWSPTGRFVDPQADITGIDALTDHIGGYQKQFPGTRIEQVGKLTSHHDVLRFHWRIAAGETTVLDGMDVGQLDSAGRLAHIVGFFERPPAAAAAAQ